MKRFIMLGSFVLSLMLLFGCGMSSDNKESETPKQQQESAKDYYPIKENVRYVYEGKGNEYASYEVYIDFMSENKVQQRKITGGTVMAIVVEIADDKVTRTLSRGGVYYREDLSAKTEGMEEVLLMNPLEKGTTWTLSDQRTRTITDTSADVTTPLGSYKALEVTTKSNNDTIVDYYVKDKGLVKSVFVSGATEISSSISKIEEDVTFPQTINFYYPSGVDDKIYFKSKAISFKTNDKTSEILEEAYKVPINGDLGIVLSEKTKINSLSIDTNNIVNIDLSKDFVSDMNAGALFEGMIIQSLVNTFGQYYNSEKVILTVDNKPYESGHIKMGKGEYFKTKFDKTVEIK